MQCVAQLAEQNFAGQVVPAYRSPEPKRTCAQLIKATRRVCCPVPASLRLVSRAACAPRQSVPLHRLTPRSSRPYFRDYGQHCDPVRPRIHNRHIQRLAATAPVRTSPNISKSHRDSNQTASGKAGAVQTHTPAADLRRCGSYEPPVSSGQDRIRPSGSSGMSPHQYTARDASPKSSGTRRSRPDA